MFQVDLDKPWNYIWYFYKKHLRPRCPLYERSGGHCPRSPASLLFSVRSINSKGNKIHFV